MGAISRISKSQYLKGMQCPKALWYYRHRPDLMPAITSIKRYLFDTGHEVGALAQTFFKDGVEITEAYNQIDKAIQSTKLMVANGCPVIYEATAGGSGAYSRIDIFKKVEGTDAWDLIEVKASTGVKDYHIDDISLQRYAFIKAGYRIRKSILMHIDNTYVRTGGIDVQQLFKLEDCTEIISADMDLVEGNVKRLIETVNGTEPVIDIGDHCFKQFECDYLYHCWQHIPEYSVYNVFSGPKRDDLLSQNIIDVANIPDGVETTDRKRIDINAYKTGQEYVDVDAINNFLDTTAYPLFYLDYETIMPGIPLFDHTRPYQQIPFQFSLHVHQEKGGSLDHIEFLHTGSGDPRPSLVNTLVSHCGNKGSVVVYNKSFEARINEELAEAFPEHRTRLYNINERMIDLLVPFRSRYLYHPDMKGSASLKSVLPAFIPNMRYDELAIQDGDMASLSYLKCLKGVLSEEEKDKIYQDLKTYCAMDTMAEVLLFNVLYEKAKQ